MDTVDVLAAVLSGDDEAASSLAALDPRVVCESALHHGVLSLVADALAAGPGRDSAVAAALRHEANRSAAADVLRETELVRVLETFDQNRLRAVVFKGAQLAYSDYPRPDLRARVDTDLLVAAADRERAHRLLVQLGYDVPAQVTGEFVSQQACYIRHKGSARVHVVDLHWQIANPRVFADVLTFDEVSAAATPLPRLAPSAVGLAPHHALLVACVHRVAHHYDSDRLVWLYDIHLLARRLSAGDWQAFTTLALNRRVVQVCRQGLVRTVSRFGGSVPQAVLDTLSPAGSPMTDEPTAAFLSSGRRQVQTFLSDVRALPGWSHRLRLVREHLFPSPHYMRDVYAPSSRAPLMLLYARRAVRGARRWFART